MFSKACEYALKSVIYLASVKNLGQKVGLKDICQAIDSPEAFTGKILQQLVREGILRSLKGPGGGFDLMIEAKDISIAKIVKIIDGDFIIKNCVLGLHECSSINPCPVHYKFKPIKDNLIDILNKTTIDEIEKIMILEQSVLKI